MITANHYSVGLLNKQDNKIKQQHRKAKTHSLTNDANQTHGDEEHRRINGEWRNQNTSEKNNNNSTKDTTHESTQELNENYEHEKKSRLQNDHIDVDQKRRYAAQEAQQPV